jgi:1,4-alpha-glucan branching enzyme
MPTNKNLQYFMMIRYLFLISFFLALDICGLKAQVLTTDPQIPNANKPVILYFHSDLETGALKNYTGPLYAHTGVNFSDGTMWQNVIESWGNNTTQPMLEYLGSFTYKLSVTPDIYTFYSVVSLSKTIKQIAIVIRSADGTKQTADLFVDIFPEGLNVNFTIPEVRSRIVELNEPLPVTANASLSDSLALYQNGLFVTGTNSSQTLSYTFSSGEYGENEVVVKAFTSTQTTADTFFYFVRPLPAEEPLPSGIKDGINYVSGNSAILCLYAPSKSYVFVLGDFSDWTANASTYMKRTPDGLRYWLQLNSLVAGKEYAYQYLVDGSILIGDPYTDKILDPWNDERISSSTYPGLKPYPKGRTTGIVSVLQTAQEPYVWKHADYSPPEKEKAVIYELLVRDFIARHDWKTLTDTLNYFSKLGITAIEIMPFNEFEGNESWGYNPSFYFAPDKYYGPKNDLKAFIDSCHSRGIAVIMDIVLNHSYGQSPLVKLYWNSELNRPAANNPWYNEVSPNTAYSWGYDFNHESRDTKDFVDRVTSYWMKEYKVDGFRFDFTKGFTNTPGNGGAYDAARITILKRMADSIRAVNPDAFVILEHFADNSEETALANYGMMIWGNMNYNYSEATMGWNEPGKSDFSRVSYKTRGWQSPNLVGYMESHDEERLMAKNLAFGNSSGAYNIKQMNVALSRIELAAAFFFTIPGPRMIWQFGELGYDISIDFNGRVGNKPILWSYLNTHPRINPVFSSLIHLKTQEPAFSTTTFNLSLASAVKRIELNHADMDVRIIGNFGVVSQAADPNFSITGTWYDYFSGESLEVTDVNASITLQPGEYRIYTTKALAVPDIPVSVTDDVKVNGEIRMFPNPVDDILYVEGKSSINQIRITDIWGRTIKTISPGSETTGIDFSGFEAGVYLLMVQQKNSHWVQRVVKR